VLRKFDLEMNFSTVDGSEVSGKIVKTSDNGWRSFQYENEQFASYELSEHEITDHERDLYAKYLLYEHALHPVVMADLLEQGRAFGSLSYQNRSGIPRLTESTYRLTDFDRSSDRTLTVPEAYRRIFAADERLNDVIELSMTQEEMTIGDYKDLMEALLRQKDYMGAQMIFFEVTTHYGTSGEYEQLAPVIRRLIHEAPDSSGVRQISAAVTKQPKTKAGLQLAIQILEDARRQEFAHGYILNVFLANYYDALGQPRKGPDLILEALEQNPFLAGAYKDLGDKYLRTYWMQDAWICWDRMREINPNHSLATSINNFEQRLKQQFPDYFM
jgi:tetratricopeptide (TPR) repeat protein